LTRAVAALALVLVALAGLASCFSPQRPGCAFSCAADGLCPSGYSCGSDGVCHRDDGQGTCDIPPQTDAGADAGDDGATDADGADAGGG
jgi:hypothetical protein